MLCDRSSSTAWRLAYVLMIALGPVSSGVGSEMEVISVWPDVPPGPAQSLPSELDVTTDSDNQVAGRRVMRLTNITRPTIHVYKPPAEHDTGTSVLICPGGGHRILAYDLEGTEVAQWLNSIGVTGIVLKYRVPAPDRNKVWHAAVQDAQRSMSLVRQRAAELKIDPDRIGILGFSAGGQAAALASLLDERQYDAMDEVDQVAFRPNFAVLVYPAYLADASERTLRPEATVTPGTPPMFLVHAFNDPVTAENSLILALGLKQASVPVELHLYATGGHGFGLRPTDEPGSRWPELCQAWLRRNGWLEQQQ